ncbi:acidic leucine-rich nuclear phosphoprotein 32 family member A-like [Lates japonicus]|uniref:Acidic leucine-rich nuclear phosphoprotein 32 family member A-like protein n=1 Tax=Lates japonicus TaxID=270547 RepID=A0AAD3M697_LATJO|nr:acidic leucine-rich nuclear phosphoprotein 32 family member A-like protein [Lates japonicus]
MVLSTSQQVALAFTAVLFTFVVLPRLFGVGGGTGAKETRFDPRYTRKGPGPGAVRGQPVNVNGPGSPQTPENMQQMKKLMEQELKSDKYKSNSNKGYVFTLMPLYAIGVGVFAAYKFLKIKSADDQAQRDKFAKGAKKSAEAENQLNELEQRLAQTERMLNSILTQLDPLTNCVKSVAQEQKNEIMSQLQTIRYLMKKRGMDCPPLNINEASCERNLDHLIESLGASDSSAAEASPVDKQSSGAAEASEKVYQQHSEAKDESATEGEEMKELIPEESDGEAEKEEAALEEMEEEEKEDRADEEEHRELMPSLEDSCEPNTEEVLPASGLRRRNRPE